jgi:hypothetical protein
MLPRCFPDASPSPRCFPDASPPQMPPTDASQMPPRCSPEAPRMLPTCFPASQMPPRCLPDASQILPRSPMPFRCFPQMPPRCLPDASHEIQIPPGWLLSLELSQMLSKCLSTKTLFGVSRWCHNGDQNSPPTNIIHQIICSTTIPKLLLQYHGHCAKTL